jgi:hypothetical protein
MMTFKESIGFPFRFVILVVMIPFIFFRNVVDAVLWSSDDFFLGLASMKKFLLHGIVD